MSRLKQYLFFFGLIVLFKWTYVGQYMQSSVFLYTVLGVIVFLWGVVAIIALRAKRKKKKENLLDKEGA